MTFPTYTDQVVVEGHDNLRHFEANEDVSQGQLVKADSNDAGRTVEPSDTDGEKALGVATYDASSGEQVAVAAEGAIVRGSTATDNITSGDYLASDGATGDEGQVTSAASGDAIVGVALQDSTGTGETSIVFQVTYGQFGD